MILINLFQIKYFIQNLFENLELMEILEDDKSNLNIILLAQSFSLVYSNSKEIPNKFDEIDQSSLDLSLIHI